MNLWRERMGKLSDSLLSCGQWKLLCARCIEHAFIVNKARFETQLHKSSLRHWGVLMQEMWDAVFDEGADVRVLENTFEKISLDVTDPQGEGDTLVAGWPALLNSVIYLFEVVRQHNVNEHGARCLASAYESVAAAERMAYMERCACSLDDISGYAVEQSSEACNMELAFQDKEFHDVLEKA